MVIYMNGKKINQEVLRVIQDKTQENENIRKFLLELMWKEKEHSGSWHFRKEYAEIIKKYTNLKD